MAHLNSAEGIQNMCATQIMTKSKSLRTGECLDVQPDCITFTFTFSHLTDAFIQSDLQLGST